MKKLIQLKLKIFAKLILKKYNPKVIGISGSIGKTSTKEAVYTVLSSKYNVRRGVKNYNNEIGLPLTIIGKDSPGKNIFGWIGVGLKAGRLILWRDKNYPQILVLEMGVDKPKDMKYLLKIARPQIAIMTGIDFVHVENFKNKLEDLIAEKERLIAAPDKNGWAILNADNKYVIKMKKSTRGKILTYGFDKKADITISNLNFSFRSNSKDINNLQGLSFKISYQGSTVPILLPDSLGVGQAYAALAAIACGIIYDLNMIDIAKSLRNFNPASGRMRLIKGIKQSRLIDDTYNAAPESTMAALDILNKLPKNSGRCLAVLGDMLELGSETVRSHQRIGAEVAKNKINLLITVGERARDIARAAASQGMSGSHIFSFADSDEAKKFVQDRIQKNDIILIKGSQGTRMEKIAKEIMAEPRRAKELLVRQDKAWTKK